MDFERDFQSFQADLTVAPVGEPGMPKAAAVLLSYKRPANLPWIVRGLLNTIPISRIVISNNNPDLKLEDWFDYSDPRVEIINQSQRRLPGYRFEIARHLDEQFIICIDDDLYLRPAQIVAMYRHLLDDPDQIHGLWGQVFYEDENGLTWRDGLRNVEQKVDVLNRAYFLTQAHIRRFIDLMQQLGYERIEDLEFVDDLLLSFSGADRPQCHDVGPLISCPSKDSEGIAAWREQDFFESRIAFYRRLEAITGRVLLPDSAR